MKKYIITFAVLAMVLAVACKKEKDTTPTNTPSTQSKIHIEMEAVDGDEVAIQLGKIYTTAIGDSVTFDFIRYWVSNLELVREDGTVWSEENSYRLIERTSSKLREDFSLEVPPGKYKSVRFSIGVAPNQNSSLDSVIGELDATLGMSWNWNTGYIFMKNEGTFYNSDSMSFQPYMYHLGMNANYKTLTLDFPMVTELSAGAEYETHIAYRALNIFGDPNAMDLKANPILKVGPADQTAKAAENYSGAFELHHFMKK